MQNSRQLDWLGEEIEKPLVMTGLIHEARLAPDGGQGRVVGMRGEPDALALGDGQDLGEETLQAAPELVGRDRREEAGGGGLVVNHVPDHAVGHREVVGALHADRGGAAARVGAGGAAGDAGEAEIVTQRGDARLAQAPDDRLDVLDVLGAPGAVEQDVMPVGGIEVLDRLQLEAGGLDLAPQGHKFVERPEFVGVAGDPPPPVRAGRLVVAPGVPAAAEIIDQMGHDMGRAGLPREMEIFAREHMAVEAEAELHGCPKVARAGVRRQWKFAQLLTGRRGAPPKSPSIKWTSDKRAPAPRGATDLKKTVPTPAIELTTDHTDWHGSISGEGSNYHESGLGEMLIRVHPCNPW